MSPRRFALVKEPTPRKFRGQSSKTGATLPPNPKKKKNQLHHLIDKPFQNVHVPKTDS